MSWIKRYARCYLTKGDSIVMLEYTISITGLPDLVVTVSYDYLGTPQIKSGITNGETIQIPAVGVSNLSVNAPDVSGYIKTITENNGVYTVTYIMDPYNGHEYVDLGLPSGIKWAKMNVGASSQTDYGLFFQWGDTQGYTSDQVGNGDGQKYFGWADYKYSNNGGSSASDMIKYNSSDGLVTLNAADDAAQAAWGGSWRMPTETEFNELLDSSNCTSTWTTVDGVSGRLFTSNSNGNTLFLPAAGYCYDGSVGNVGSVVLYWSSSFLTSYVFNGRNLSSSRGGIGMSGSFRSYGYSVRGIVSE